MVKVSHGYTCLFCSLCSVLDVHLNGSLEVGIVFITTLELEVNKESVVRVEVKELVTAALIYLEFVLEGNGIAAAHNVRRPTIDAMTVL